MIHYHGGPVTPDTAAVRAYEKGHAFVSFASTAQLDLVQVVAQSFAIDNGAFGAWSQGRPITDWKPFYEWAKKCIKIPSCDFAVIPDVIGGSEEDNDNLLLDNPLPRWFSAPVWHMHESTARLERLAADYPRVCLGSSGEFSQPGSTEWWARIETTMRVVCDSDGFPLTKLHGLRMLDPKIFTKIPLSSADSTNIGRNIGIDKKWTGAYQPLGDRKKEARAQIIRDRIESFNSPCSYAFNN